MFSNEGVLFFSAIERKTRWTLDAKRTQRCRALCDSARGLRGAHDRRHAHERARLALFFLRWGRLGERRFGKRPQNFVDGRSWVCRRLSWWPKRKPRFTKYILEYKFTDLRTQDFRKMWKGEQQSFTLCFLIFSTNASLNEHASSTPTPVFSQMKEVSLQIRMHIHIESQHKNTSTIGKP